MTSVCHEGFLPDPFQFITVHTVRLLGSSELQPQKLRHN